MEFPFFLYLSLFLSLSLSLALEVIPYQAKKDYMEALEQAPQLILEESHPIHFLRTLDYNPWQTAKKLVLHWQYRKWLFQNRHRAPSMNHDDDDNNDSNRDPENNPDRWLLPLRDATTGRGALTKSDIQLLHTGWLAWVWPRQQNKNSQQQQQQHPGRFLVVDHGRFQNFTLDAFLRVLFYLGTIATDRVAQTIGVTSLRLIATTNSSSSSTDNNNHNSGEPPLNMAFFKASQTSYKMMKEALPMRLKRVVFLKKSVQRGSMMHFFLNRVEHSVGQIMNDHHDSSNTTNNNNNNNNTSSYGTSAAGMSRPASFVAASPVTIDVPSAAQAADLLAEMGFPRDALPDSHAGTWTYDRLFEWQQQNAKTNPPAASSSSSPSDQSTDDFNERTTSKQQQELVKIAAVDDPALKIPIPWLVRQSRENAALASLGPTASLNSAAQQQTSAEQDDRTKQVSALYARKAYQKRKQKQTEIEIRAQELKEEQERLQAENARLESLLQQARNVVALLDDEGNRPASTGHSAEYFEAPSLWNDGSGSAASTRALPQNFSTSYIETSMTSASTPSYGEQRNQLYNNILDEDAMLREWDIAPFD